MTSQVSLSVCPRLTVLAIQPSRSTFRRSRRGCRRTTQAILPLGNNHRYRPTCLRLRRTNRCRRRCRRSTRPATTKIQWVRAIRSTSSTAQKRRNPLSAGSSARSSSSFCWAWPPVRSGPQQTKRLNRLRRPALAAASRLLPLRRRCQQQGHQQPQHRQLRSRLQLRPRVQLLRSHRLKLRPQKLPLRSR